MNSFEITISFIRDILRIEVITGLDSINHCISFLIPVLEGPRQS